MKKKSIAQFFIILAVLLAVFYFFFRIKDGEEIENKSSVFSVAEPDRTDLNISIIPVDSFMEQMEDQRNRRVMTFFVDHFIESIKVRQQIFDYANKIPLTPNGFTAMFFFDDMSYTPRIPYFTEEFGEPFASHCVAGYWKYSNGTDIYRKYPFKTK